MKRPSVRRRLPRSFYNRKTDVVAAELLGKALVRRIGNDWLGGIIVETEAYLAAGDLASHSARGRTASNAAMFGPPGTLYVYPIHAKFCMNAVTEAAGLGAAVLIRALEPVWGIEEMRLRRNQHDERKLTRGPAMICQALAVDRSEDGTNLVTSRQLYIADTGNAIEAAIVETPRIGISKSAEMPLRFFLNRNRYVSGRVRDHR